MQLQKNAFFFSFRGEILLRYSGIYKFNTTYLSKKQQQQQQQKKNMKKMEVPKKASSIGRMFALLHIYCLNAEVQKQNKI